MIHTLHFPISDKAAVFLTSVPALLIMLISDITISALGVAFLASIPPTIAAIAALRQGKRNATKAEETNVKTEEISKKADAIHILTNSNLTQITAQLQVASEKIAGLEKLVTALTSNKAVVAALEEKEQKILDDHVKQTATAISDAMYSKES